MKNIVKQRQKEKNGKLIIKKKKEWNSLKNTKAGQPFLMLYATKDYSDNPAKYAGLWKTYKPTTKIIQNL